MNFEIKTILNNILNIHDNSITNLIIEYKEYFETIEKKDKLICELTFRINGLNMDSYYINYFCFVELLMNRILPRVPERGIVNEALNINNTLRLFDALKPIRFIEYLTPFELLNEIKKNNKISINEGKIIINAIIFYLQLFEQHIDYI